MMNRVSDFKIGLFVTGTLLLLIVMLYYLGLSDLFVQKARISTFFQESVQGLAVGAQVKYKGAQIGSVDRIKIYPNRRLIQVDMAVELRSFMSQDSQKLFPDDDAFFKFLEKEIANGLRCRLEYSGITGLRFIDFDYFAQPGQQLENPGIAVEGFLMPSAPSALRDVVKSLNTSLERISRIRFEEISDNLIRNMDDLNRILTSEDIQKTLRHLSSMALNMDNTTTAFTQVLTEEKLRELLNELEIAMQEFRRFTELLHQETARSKFPETAAAIRNAADICSALVQERNGDIRAALDSWIRTMEIIRELADNLNRDPASVIRGRK